MQKSHPHPLLDDSDDGLSDEGLLRFSRHVILPELGEYGQAKLLKSKVAVIGAGGLGSSLLYYLAAAGIGTLTIIDHDMVDISNLQRQIIHSTPDINRAKVSSAAEKLEDLNPHINIVPLRDKISTNTVDDFLKGHDVVVDGSDNFTTRYLVASSCARQKIPLVSAAIIRFEGQLSLFKPYMPNGACYRCLYPDAPDARDVPRCDTVGIISPLAGILGSMQALEVIKEILGIGQSLFNRLLLFDGLDMRFHEIKLKKQEKCDFCNSL